MALSPNVVVVATGELITAAHLNNIRSNLDRLDTTKLFNTNDTMSGTLTMSGATGGVVATQPLSRIFLAKAATSIDVVGVEAHGQGDIWVTNNELGRVNLQLQHQGASSAGGQQFLAFRTLNQGIIGSISQVGTSGVQYNTASDRRLKDIVGDVASPLTRLMELHPRRLRWKADEVEFDGFIADEVEAVLPEVVTGERNAVFPDDHPTDPGRIDPQQLNMAGMLPVLVAAVQELTARVAELEAAAA